MPSLANSRLKPLVSAWTPLLARPVEAGALGSGDGSDVDDYASAGRGQVRARRLAAEEHSAEVDVEQAVEFGRIVDLEARAVGGSGVVDEQVQSAERFGRRVDGRLYGFQVAEVQRNDVRSAAEGLDLDGQFIQPHFVARGQRHVRAGLGQREGNGPPDAAAGAGYKGAAAIKAEAIGDGHWRFRNRCRGQRSRDGQGWPITPPQTRPLAGCPRRAASRAARLAWRPPGHQPPVPSARPSRPDAPPPTRP